MRSPSQTFADFVAAREYYKARQCLAQWGADTVQAPIWVALHAWSGRTGQEELLDDVFGAGVTATAWADAFLRRLALPGDDDDPMLQRLLDKADAHELAQRAAIHHAAYHGKVSMLEPLRKKLEEAGQWRGWNEDIHGMGTPLYLALREFQETCIVALMQRDCDPDHPIGVGVRGSDGQRSVLEAAKIGGKHRAELEDRMGHLRRKVALEEIAGKAGKLLGMGAEKLRKIRM